MHAQTYCTIGKVTALVFAAGTVALLFDSPTLNADTSETPGHATPGESEEPPATFDVTGIVRDFKEKTVEGGHPDFERRPEHGYGHYSGNIDPTLGEDFKPVYSGGGFKVTEQWRDSEHRQICYNLYNAELGDNEGRQGQASTGGVLSPESFDQWYNDIPGVNMSAPLTLTLVRQDDGKYVFDDSQDPLYSELRGFFPIEDDSPAAGTSLFGNPGGQPDRNFHFTFELHLLFTYDAGGDQFFKFIGDDDVYVFVNNSLVIDLGGVHAAHDQYVDMSRLGLTDGEPYTIDFFFAERHRTQSNFRIETNLLLESAPIPTVTAAYD